MNRTAGFLVTGFEPFGGREGNISGELALRLDGQMVAGCPITGRQLPVRYRDAAEQAAGWAVERPWRGLLALGLRAERREVSLERLAVNVRHSGSADNSGQFCRHEPIDPAGPAGLWTTWNNDAAEDALQRAGIPVAASYSAGTYICNDVMYAVLRRLRRARRRIPFGFVHLPLAGAGPEALSASLLELGVVAALRTELAV